MTFQMFNREFNINRDGRKWMSSSGGQWETQMNFSNNGSIRRYTPDAIEGIYMAHNNCVAVSAGDVSNASNQYIMCDEFVKRTIFNKPVDVLGNIYTNADVNCVNVNIATDGKFTIDTICELYRYVSAFSSFDMRNTDANSSSRFICGDPAVQSNIVGAVMFRACGFLILLLLM